jgi:predicted small lipoprotein YifL
LNNMIRKAVLVPMAFLTLFSLFGCGKPRDERAAEEILKSMQKKYGEEFVLDGIGGSWGTMNNNTLKAIVRPKNDPTLKVPVEITKDFKQIYDQYLNQRVARNEEPKIQELARKYWPDARIDIANDTRLTYPEENDTSMSYTEFLKLYPMNTQLISIYLDGSNYVDEQGSMDQEEELDKYLEFAELLTEHHYVSSTVTWVFLTPEGYKRLDEARSSSSSVNVHLLNMEKKTGEILIATMVGYKLNAQGQIKETRAEINSYFDTWKEKRIESLGQRGGA